MISTADYMAFIDTALDGMTGILTDLGDDVANRKPDMPGANTPYVILTHCLGVMRFYSGEAVAGRQVDRDRPAEFTASGPVAELVARTRQVRDQFAADIATLDGAAPPRRPLKGPQDHTRRTQGGVLLHVYEELSQHYGHMEITRDLLRTPWVHST